MIPFVVSSRFDALSDFGFHFFLSARTAPSLPLASSAQLLARAGKGLSYRPPQRDGDGSGTGSSDSESDEGEKEPERPFEPLCVWTSPHQGGEPKGLPPRL